MKSEAHVADLLSDYADGHLGAEEHSRVRRHLSECGACARMLRDLQSIVREAGALPLRSPPRDLWSGIESRLAERASGTMSSTPGLSEERLERRARILLSIPQALAAGLALMTLSSGAVWTLMSNHTASEPGRQEVVSVGPAPRTPVDLPLPVELASDVIRPEVSDELARLEGELAANLDRLEASTVRVIERNLLIIDRAISESVEALRADPLSTFFREHLDRAIQRKTLYLQRALQGPMRSS